MISNKVVYLQKKIKVMGVLIFVVLVLNVIGTMCGGSSNWGGIKLSEDWI